jgi:hypothetical protein
MPNRATVPGGQEWGDSLLPPKVLVKPDPAQTTANDKIPCGERLALGPKGLVAAAKINFSTSYLLQASTTGAILLINGDNGQVMKNIPTLAAPLDVLVASIN